MIGHSKYSGRIAIVGLKGRLTGGPALSQLKPGIDAIVSAKSSTGLVLDLDQVPYIDSMGLGELVWIHTSAVRRGISMALVNVNIPIREAFAMTRLDEFFTICPDETSALQRLA